MHFCDVTVYFEKQLENWLGNVLDICVSHSLIDFLFGVPYKSSFNGLHLLSYSQTCSKDHLYIKTTCL